LSFLPAELIKKKRDGGHHTREEIEFLILENAKGNLPDYQMAAWLMAVFFRGMNADETHALTEVMLHSGQVLDFSNISVAKVDKHSTGGVGDKTSLILGPIVAAAGLAVPMIAGRGLGHTGGTLDKLESIPGFSIRMSETRFHELVAKHGLCFMGQTDQICPADKKIYALRDVTATIESFPLICASIMSKKLAEGIDALVLDVKYGSGAFMKTASMACDLAAALKDIGDKAGKRVHAFITNMDQPTGHFMGNALEVQEVLHIMNGSREHEDTRSLSLDLAAHMIFLGNKTKSIEEARALSEEILVSGRALRKFEEVVAAQGGDLSQLPKAQFQSTVKSPQKGYLSAFNTESIGYSCILLGAGRLHTSDPVDPTAGLKLHKKLGEPVESGENIFTLYSNNKNTFAETEARLKTCFQISESPFVAPTLIDRIMI